MIPVLDRRLAVKVSLVIVAIEVIVLGSLGWWFTLRYHAQIDARVAAQARLPGALMQAGAMRYGAVRDPAGLSHLIGQEVDQAAVIRLDGSLFEAHDPALIGRQAAEAIVGYAGGTDPADVRLEQAQAGGRAYVVHVTPLRHADRPIGWLYLRIDTSRAEAEKRALAWRYAVGVAGSIALTSLVQILLIQRLVGRRIRGMVEVLARAGGGDLAVRVPGPLSRDEIGRVQGGINAMLNEVGKRTREREDAAAALAESEAKYRLLVEHQSDLVVKVDLEGRFLYVSPSYCRTFGKRADELIGNSFLPLVHEDDRASTAAAMAGLHQPPYAVSLRQRALTVDGWRWFSWQDTLVRDAGGEAVAIIGVGRDITRQMELEAQLQQAQKMDALGQLAGGVAHDFNNQLTGILAPCDLLERGLAEDDPRRSHIDMIRRSAEAAEGLTRSLLAFARRMPIRRRAIDLRGVVEDTLALVRRSIDRRIVLTSELPKNPVEVLADAGAMQNALLNLALNARDAMPEGGIMLVALRVLEPGHGEEGLPAERALAEISVTDSGGGIPPDQLQRIFEPFFTTKPVGKGTGLGLATTYAALRDHGGAVRVASRPGCTVFRLLLPCGGETADPTRAVPRPSATADLAGLTILVVDDEPVLRHLARELLRAAGAEVLIAEDGAQAVAILAREGRRVACVMLDLVMPEMGGVACFERIRAADPGLPVVLCSGYDREAAIERLLATGTCAFIAKPYKVPEMLATIAALARRQPPGGVSR